jgi:hypothetical protein
LPKDPDFWGPDTPIIAALTWEAVRAQTLMRPMNGRCEYCGKRRPADAHHRWLHGQGGPDLCHNLAAVCRQCHDFLHAHPVEARVRGFMVESWQNPADVEMTLWDGMVVLLDDAYGYQILRWPWEPAVLA